jgi:Carboxypeptidase regulatory-like domain
MNLFNKNQTMTKRAATSRVFLHSFVIAAAALVPSHLQAQVTGKLSGAVKDQTGAAIPNAAVTLENLGNGIKQDSRTDAKGAFLFPVVAVGNYSLSVDADGFTPYRQNGIAVHVGSAAQFDVVLQVAARGETVNVTDSGATVETSDTQLGQVIVGKQVTALPLNGRSYTDLLAIQAGVDPITTSGQTNNTSGGSFGYVPVSGGLTTGQFSVHGQRESANGFFLNGVSIQEAIGQQAGIIPNLDSIAEFRVLTSNADAQYGGYSGGLINVVTKSGTNDLHGSLFEFLRNTVLDSRNYFSPERATFQQNEFGATVGGPIRKDKIFFFADYQGQCQVQGQETGIVNVPSLLNRGGNFSANATSLSGSVNGNYLAQTLSSRLGYPVSSGEPFYTAGCSSTAACVFPNAIIPQRAWSLPSTRLLPYIPTPNIGSDEFSSGSAKLRLGDDKGSMRIDANTAHRGNFSLYYDADGYTLNNPLPSGFGGATVPGFNALSNGRSQLAVFAHTWTLGASAVNEFRMSYMRIANQLGVPQGGVGVSLASQGFSTGPEGIQPGYAAYEGVANLIFNNFTIGTNPFELVQTNNTYDLNDAFSKVIGNHTINFGGQFTEFRVKENPDLVANGQFTFAGSGSQSTGNGFADFLLGLPDQYSQQSSPAFHEKSTLGGLFIEDSWNARPNLTINYGLRWDYVRPWSEERNQATTLILGENSQTFPGAPTGYVVPGDPGVPSTIAPTPLNDFSPRIGIAYSPSPSNGWLGWLTGGPGKTSIRAGFGRYFTSIEGLTIAYPTGNPPYGLTYNSSEPPVFSQPFVGALTGTQYVQQFPVHTPPYGVSPKDPAYLDWSRYTPINGAISYFHENRTPYSMNFHFTVERQLGSSTLISAGYVGTLGRHLLTVVGANPGVPSTCLSLSQPQDVAPGTPTCGPFLENQVFTRANGTIVNGTRAPFPNTIGSDGYFVNMGNSNYNGLELSVKRTMGRATFLASYTYSKSLDWSSNLQEQINPYDYRREYGPSAFDIRNDFVVSYNYNLPFESLLHARNRLTEGWSLSGITRFASGVPVTFASLGDNALVNVQNNGVNAISIDLPDVAPGNLEINNNPRNGRPAFNTALFSPNPIGTFGNAARRFFAGPGIENWDIAVHKTTHIIESKSLELRFETFNSFNHAQFYGASAVDGNINDPNFGRITKADNPRFVQIAAKLTF